jgi:hypothetical protein
MLKHLNLEDDCLTIKSRNDLNSNIVSTLDTILKQEENICLFY